MPIEETKEQQQMYGLFRSCIYVFLIIELVMNLPIQTDNLYAITSILGTMLVHQGGDGIARYYNYKLGDDRFNFENESFEQSEEKNENENENEYSVNIPMIYYYKRKMHKGWINIINPFRATIVLGTPGSGKSFGIIDPFIRQHSAKGFTMMVYDYKFPTLAKNLFYQYCKNKRYNHLPENCAFNIVNFTDVEYSNRINPIQRKSSVQP